MHAIAQLEIESAPRVMLDFTPDAHDNVSGQGEAIDLTNYPPKQVVDFFDDLTQSNEGESVLHGSHGLWPALKPRRANDIDTESGNQTAIYLTSGLAPALRFATCNKRIARAVAALGNIDLPETEVLDTGMLGCRTLVRDVTEFMFTPTMYKAIKEAHEQGRLPEILRDGFIYEVDTADCEHVPETDPNSITNYISYKGEIIPKRVYKISAWVGAYLLETREEYRDPRFSVRPYTPDEMQSHLRALPEQPLSSPLTRAEFDAYVNGLDPDTLGMLQLRR